MERFTKNIIKLNIDEISDFKFPYDERFGLEIINKDVKYEFLIRLSSTNDNLIVFGAGAFERSGPKKLDPPVFRRHSWDRNFEESVLFYNDPTIYLDPNMRVGWGVGTPDNYYLEVMAKIIENIGKSADIKNENMVFFGGSGGGFTSVQLATLIKESTALVNNSQMILKNFNNHNTYNKMIEVCFGGLSEETIYEKYGYRLDALEMFKREKYVPPIFYLLNAYSTVDIIEQCIPFVEGLHELKDFRNSVEIIIYYDRKYRHMPLQYEYTKAFLDLVNGKNLHDYTDNISLQFKIKSLKEENEDLKEQNERYLDKINYFEGKMNEYKDEKWYKSKKIDKISKKLKKLLKK